jgi:nucleotide-binding universal stress UspA family protein
MSIVVATDFSPCSRAATRLGAALARRQRTPLILVHAVEPPAIDVPPLPMGMTGWERDMTIAAEIGISKDANDVRQGDAVVETRVLIGTAASVILEVATEQQAELIVVGTHGRKRGAHMFLGNVAESVLRATTCPVLVTRETTDDVARWEGTAPLRLAVGTDGSAASQAALSWVGSFTRAQASELSIIRLYWPPEEAIRYGLDDPWGGPHRDSALLPLLERDLRRDAHALVGRAPERLRFRAAGRDAADVLEEEATSLGADALVIGVPRHRSLRWTVLKPGPVLRSSTLPVLCVPAARSAAHPQPKQVRSLLIATDLSDISDQVVGPAYGLLLPAGGRVELCTVHAVGVADAIAVAPLESPLSDQKRADCESRLRALVPPEAEAAGITTQISVIEARFAAEAIIAAAERLDVDLIAVASHGRSGIKRALLGSVAEEVARRSTRPVLIVRSQQRV